MGVVLVRTQKNIKDLDIYTINSIHGANLTLLKKAKLSKQSNAFISNINYLLSFVDDKEKPYFEILEELYDGLDNNNKDKDKNIKISKIKDILSFYGNLLSIDFFKILMMQYEEEKPTESCIFLSKDEKVK